MTMKFLAVFTALIAVACAGKTWTLQDLSQAIDSKYTDPTLKLYLVKALDDMVYNLYSGNQVEFVTVAIPASSGVSLSLSQLSEIIQNPYSDQVLQPYYEVALDQVMDDIFSGKPEAVATVVMPALEVYHYSLNELSEALQNPTTSVNQVPYLETALNKFMDAIYSGKEMQTIVIALPVEASEASAPSPPASPVPAASPLVQIIVNVNQ